MPPTRRALLLVVGVATLALTAALLPLKNLPDTLAGIGPAATVLGVLAGAALLVALVPRTPISLAFGVLFGAALGAVGALLAAVLAAVVTFAAGRTLGRDWVAARLGKRLTRIDEWAGRGGVLAVATVRSVPIAPFGLVGYAFGASSVRAAHHLAGTALAAAPSAISYALIGAAAIHGSPILFLPAAAGLACSTLLAVRLARTANRAAVRSRR